MNSHGDEITTIFVVGFPEDMKEREFQNMFTFSLGFEAATLKIPNRDEVDQDMGATGKKQIIGFAKFRSRKEAIDAREILTGRKVDAEKNCILKAEMAKKNLHTKRGLSSIGNNNSASGIHLSSTLNGSSDPSSNNNSSALSSTGGGGVRPNSTGSNNQGPSDNTAASTTANNSTSSSGGGANVGGLSANVTTTIPMSADPQSAFSFPRGLTNLHSAGLGPVRPLNLNISGSRAFDPFNDGSLNSAPLQGSLLGLHQDQRTPANFELFDEPMSALDASNALNRRTSFNNIVNGSRAMGLNLPKAPIDRRNTTELPTPNTASHAHHLEMGQIQSRLSTLSVNHMGMQTGLSSPLPGLHGQPQSATIIQTGSGLSIPAATTRSVNSNDQNPPCNTLYVGNLPVNTQEEELRMLFQRAHGYKRMSFRTKANSGPMCFVEFDDITCATLALRELDGQKLSSSTGSGIRLSYSKNPLGVRSQNNPNYQQHPPPSAHPIKHLNGSIVNSTGVSLPTVASIGSPPSMLHSAASATFLDSVQALSQSSHQTPLPVTDVAAMVNSPVVIKGHSPLSRGTTLATEL
ncbi:hypothetical protein H4219_002009 [Mycoemilia scoparia]|uniref:RRM domain-containing protein n=1 Tax=Mycoemilia scoparia TaxID=417184 RepID=A0A9W8A3L8_9FUNG|nr:hypothetical protein H4219_002009 [Mycoemilia scoparia]